MKKLNSRIILKLLFLSLTFTVVGSSFASDLAKVSIIPKPVSVTATGKYFELKENTVITIAEGSKELLSVAQYLANRLNPATGFNIAVQSSGQKPDSNYISF